MDSEECEHDEKRRRKKRHNFSDFNANLRTGDTKKRKLSTPFATKEKHLFRNERPMRHARSDHGKRRTNSDDCENGARTQHSYRVFLISSTKTTVRKRPNLPRHWTSHRSIGWPRRHAHNRETCTIDKLRNGRKRNGGRRDVEQHKLLLTVERRSSTSSRKASRSSYAPRKTLHRISPATLTTSSLPRTAFCSTNASAGCAMDSTPTSTSVTSKRSLPSTATYATLFCR